MEELKNSDFTTKWGLIYGVSGLILVLITSMLDLATKGFAVQALLWFVTVGLALAIYFLLTGEYKKENKGLISFGKAFSLILVAALIGGVIRALGFYLYIKFIDVDYMARVVEAQQIASERMGLSQPDPSQMPEFLKFFQTEEFMLISTFFSVMLGALILGLIVAAIVQKKEDYSY